MKITAGMGDLEDFASLAQAGAEEVFTGFVPSGQNTEVPGEACEGAASDIRASDGEDTAFYETEKFLPALNRREVFFYHVNISSYGDMKILRRMADRYGVQVTVTFNSLKYADVQLQRIAEIIGQLQEIGFSDYIIADLALIRYLDEHPVGKKPVNIHISGEIGEWNSAVLRVLKKDYFRHGNVIFKRLIFHRKVTLEDMRSIISTGRMLFPELTYEAFLLNEMCHYTGGFCNSLHCDAMVHICQLPYKLSPEAVLKEEAEEYEEADAQDIVGMDGCGLCALYQLNQIGIDYLKIVGRGKSGERMAEDIRAVKMALAVCKETEREKDYVCRMKKALFPKGCLSVCYYNEVF